MKFDMSAAWNEATRLIAANRQVIAVVAGVFFFLPAVIYGLVFTNQITAIQANQGNTPDMEGAIRAVVAVVDEAWWIIVLTTIIQWVGTLILVVLWTDHSRPTVGQAIRMAGTLLLPLIGAQLVLLTLWGLLFLLPVAMGSNGAVGAAVLVGLVAAIAIVYTYIKFSLVPVVIGSERVKNPLAALARSWRLTKGNSLRLFFFLLLLTIALVVISSVASLIVGLVLALAGAEVAMIGQTFASGLVSAVFSVVFLATLVAVYRQLSAPAPRAMQETFE